MKKQEKLESPPDKEWFTAQIKTKGLTLRGFAKAAGMEPATLSRIWGGQRKVKTEIAAKMAKHLGVPVTELMRALAGARKSSAGMKTLPIRGWLDGNLVVHYGAVKGPQRVLSPVEGDGLHALRFQSAGGSLSGMDGFHLFFRPQTVVALAMVGTTCIVKVKGQADLKMRTVHKGYTPGRFNLFDADGKMLLEEDVVLESTSKIHTLSAPDAACE